MPECAQSKFTGRKAVLEFQIACPEDTPVEADWLRVGPMTTKDLSLEWDLTEADGDDNDSPVMEQLAASLNMTVSGDGLCMKSDTTASNQIRLTQHVHSPDETGDQPYAWIRLTYPDLTFTFPALVTNMSRTGENRSAVTFSFEATAVRRGTAVPTPAVA